MSGQAVLFDNPGPKARARHRVIAVVGALVILGFLAFAVTKLAEHGNFDADKWTPFIQPVSWTEYLLPGLADTLIAAAGSLVAAAVFGLVFGIGRMSRIRWVRWLCAVVVEFFRAVPVLVMMLAAFTFYVTNGVFIDELNPLMAVITGLTLYNGSVVAELIRSGVGSLPKGQREAGLSIGLTPWKTLMSIQLPQAITAMMPALVGQLVVVIKDTALGFIAATYAELVHRGQDLWSWKSNPVPTIIVVALIFIVINYTISRLATVIDDRLNRRGRTTITGAAPPGLSSRTVDMTGAEPIADPT